MVKTAKFHSFLALQYSENIIPIEEGQYPPINQSYRFLHLILLHSKFPNRTKILLKTAFKSAIEVAYNETY
jgi:hypothetical protein